MNPTGVWITQHKAGNKVLACISRISNENDMVEGNKSRVLHYVAHAHSNSSHEKLPRIKWNTKRTYAPKQTRSVINKNQERWTRTPGNLFTTTKGARGKSKCGRHQTHYVYRSNRTMPSYVQPGKQIHNSPLQNRWKPHPCWANEEQNIKQDVQGIQQPNGQDQAKQYDNQKVLFGQ